MLRKVAAAVAVTAAALAGGGGVAAGQEGEEHGGRPEPFEVTCGGVDYLVVTGAGNWAAAISVDHHTVFIPKSFTFTFTVTDAEGNVIDSGTETDEKGRGNAHRNQETITCEFSETFTEDGVTVSFSGSAEVVQRP